MADEYNSDFVFILKLSCNDVWYLDLLRFEWTLVNTGEVKPVKRAYHSQVSYFTMELLKLVLNYSN